MNAAETWTIGRLLTWTTDYFKQAGSQSPRLDAEVLLAHARDCQRIELYTAFDQEPSESQRAAFRELVRRRAAGAPVAYLVGFKEFYSLGFEVTPAVLIPRPETEHLVVEALDQAKTLAAAEPRQLQVVDVGTGSGCIAVAFAKHGPQCHLIAVDLSPAALEVARRNADRHGLTTSDIEFVQGDLLEWCLPDQRFDLILSNPPYIAPDEFAQLPREVREFEPQLALLAEQGGGAVIRRLISQAARHLAPGGSLIFELSPMLADRLGELIEQPENWQPPRLIKDIAGHPRVVTLRRG